MDDSAPFQESIRDDGALDPQFKSLLKHHWMEKLQHAQLDTLTVEAISDSMSQTQVDEAIDGYLQIGLPRRRLEAAGGVGSRGLRGGDRPQTYAKRARALMAQQHQANRWTYLSTGMTHPNLLGTLVNLSRARRKMLESVALGFCWALRQPGAARLPLHWRGGAAWVD